MTLDEKRIALAAIRAGKSRDLVALQGQIGIAAETAPNVVQQVLDDLSKRGFLTLRATMAPNTIEEPHRAGEVASAWYEKGPLWED